MDLCLAEFDLYFDTVLFEPCDLFDRVVSNLRLHLFRLFLLHLFGLAYLVVVWCVGLLFD